MYGGVIFEMVIDHGQGGWPALELGSWRWDGLEGLEGGWEKGSDGFQGLVSFCLQGGD